MNKYSTSIEEVLSSIRKHSYLYISTLVIYLLSKLIISIYSKSTVINLSLYAIIFSDIGKITLVTYFSLYFTQCIRTREPSPLYGILQKIISLKREPSRLIIFIINLFSITVVMSSFTAIKFIIPQITPFSFDLQLHEIDKFLHFGHMPWQLTHKLFSSPYMTSIIGIAYNIWFFIVWYVLFHFLISKHAVRSQFLLSFTLIWFVIGNLMAILLSSAGPCYAHLLNSSFSDYQPLMEKLHLHNQTLSSQGWWPIWALDTQNMLWRQYSTNIITIGAGISAMPSMHVALATLMALAFWRISKKIGVWFIAYAVVIQIGSVHLAWHYAIDGYIGAIATYVIWRFSGWVLQ